MIHCCKILTFTVAALICSVSSADSPNDQNRVDVIAHLQAVADAKLDLVQAMHDRQQQRVDAVESLHKSGHSSFREQTIVQIELLNLAAQLASAKQYSGFVAKAAAASDTSAAAMPPVGANTTVIVTVQGLAADPRTQLLSSIVVDVPRDNDAVEEMLARNHPPVATSLRAEAWTELCERLGNLQDGTTALRNEHAIAVLDKNLAIATSRLAALSNATVNVCEPIGQFNVNEYEISSVQDLITAATIEADQLHYLAVRNASDSTIGLIAEWNRRVAIAADKGASPQSELPMLDRMLASTQYRGQFANETLQSITAAKQTQNDDNVTFVTADHDAMHPHLGVSHAQLINIREASIDRLLSAATDVQTAQQRLARVQQGHAKLAKLATQDDYFRGELERAKLSVQVADAGLENAKFQHQQRMLENEYIVGRIESKSPQQWLQPLSQLLSIQSESKAEQVYAQARLAKEQWLVDGLTRLYESRSATWKELTAAKVRCAELQEEIQSADADRVAAGLAAQLLSSTDIELKNDKTLATVQ